MPSPQLNEITIQTWVDGLFVQILPLNFTVTAKKENPGNQPRRTEVYWESRSGLAISPRADVSVCDFIQLQSIYLSHNVNTDVEQRRVEMNSPVPQHTRYIVSEYVHNLNDTEINMHARTHTLTHTLWHEFVYPARSGLKRTLVDPLSIWCVKSGRKSKSFPSFGPVWVVVPWGRRGETGSKVSLRLQSLGSVWSAARCQSQQRKLLVTGTNRR